MNCSTVAAYGGLALSGFVPMADLRMTVGHLSECPACATHLAQTATTSALIAAHGARGGAATNSGPPAPGPLGATHRFLTEIAREADPAHADDLVQETWDHLLSRAPSKTPRREDLAAYLLQVAAEHRQGDEATEEEWADSVATHHVHPSSAPDDVDLPSGFEAQGSPRQLADLAALDADADRAELLLPDLYSDGDDIGGWISTPKAWPSATQLLAPEDEAQTEELYAVVDAALDELPADVGDVLFLVDVEGLTLRAAAEVVHRDPASLQRELARGRNHVRSRVDDYLRDR